MAWTVDELNAWLDKIEPRIDKLDLFAWLELTAAATYADIQPAFHAVARSRHPDLFRTRLSAAELDRLVRVYARITSAYAELRDPTRFEAYARPRRPARVAPQVARTPTPVQVGRTPTSPQVGRAPTSPQVARTTTPPPQVARTTTSPVQVARTATLPPQIARTATATGPQAPRTTAPPPAADDGGPIEPSRAMSPRALAYYRRAEGALRVGDHATALLQLRMALATDPSSTLLRAALKELAELIQGR